MRIYNRKKREWVEIKDFLRQWKEGMRNITPLQQTITIQFGHIISGIGVIWGIIFSIRLGYYWMMGILLGGLIVLSVQYLGNWQKKMILKQIEDMSKSIEQVSLLEITKEVNDGNPKLVR